MGDPEKNNLFTIGLTMAGAVSAGAYTAGVLDYLLRALEAHNARVDDENDLDRPRHKVALKVMSGASAGGVCAALGVAGLIKNRKPGEARLADPTPVGTEDDKYSYDYVLEPLHDVWVEGLRLWIAAGDGGLLSVKDLDDERWPVRSLLNGSHIDTVANSALKGITQSKLPAGGECYSFLAEDLDVFLTATNLSGVPYTVSFAAGEEGAEASDGHPMAQHAAVRHFRVSGLGEQQIPSPWLDGWNDEGIGLPLPAEGEALPIMDPTSPWGAFRVAAIATGAFPLGLAARPIESVAAEFGRLDPSSQSVSLPGGAFPVDAFPSELAHARPDFGDWSLPDHVVRYVAVDGGLMNNEPFEYARFTIRPKSTKPDHFLDRNPREPDKADRAVIMVDPFPEGPDYTPLSAEDVEARRGLVSVFGQLLPALKNQARFKPTELFLAAKEEVHSRYLIAPSRGPRSGPPGSEGTRHSGAEAIASGGLGGFLGFFHEDFRRHDFILGQRNCQSFLKKHFMLVAEHSELDLRDDGTGSVRIVDPGPDFEKPIPLPPWPRIATPELEPMLNAAKRRLGRVGGNLLAQHVSNSLLECALERLWKAEWFVDGIKKRLHVALIQTVVGTLIERQQLVETKGQSSARRQLLTALLRQGDEPATALDIYKAVVARYGGDAAVRDSTEAERELEHMATDDDKLVWRSGGALLTGFPKYTHALLRPSRLAAARIRLTG